MKYWQKGWVKKLAVIASYCIIYVAMLPFADLGWSLMAPLRLAYLILLPYEYWWLLAVTDGALLSYINFSSADRFGYYWATVSSFPRIVLAMPIVWWCRNKLELFPNKQLVNFKVLLLCTVLAAIAWQVQINLALLHSFYSPGHPYVLTLPAVILGMIGTYIPMVAMLPWVLMARAEYLSQEPWQQRLRNVAKETFAADTLALFVSAALFVYWLHQHSVEDARRLSYLAVFLPIAWLTLKPGWRAAALGGTPAILCVISLLERKPNGVTIESEAFVAFTITCLFTLGARITAQSLKEEQDRLEVEQALQLARQNFQLSETRIRKTAQALQVAGTSLQLTQHQLLDRIHDVLPESEVQRYYRQAASMQDHVNRLVDSMYPSAWRQRGLSAALHETIADALREAAINYRCRISGSLDDLTPGIHAAIYRLACESVMHINRQLVCSSIRLGVRSGATANGYWVALRVEGKLDNSHINDAMFDTTERDMLGSRLGAYGLGLLALRNHARLFGGELRSKVTENGLRLSYMLVDAINRPMEQLTDPQPWIA
jgi:glucose-6-phosphate-specific signal transduction histidine kinase